MRHVNEVIFESDDEEVEKSSILPELKKIFNSSIFASFNQLACSAKSIILETTTPPTAPECQKCEVTIVAKTLTNSTIRMDLGHGGYYCHLKTTISSPDPYGIYWCPYPKCNKKSRKRYLLKDHLKKPIMVLSTVNNVEYYTHVYRL